MLRKTEKCRVLVCGGRYFNDDEKVFSILNNYSQDHDFTALIHGAAKGADSAAGRWANLSSIKEISFPANWKKFGKSAGPIRNQRMIDEGKPDLVIAFAGGRGTANMVNAARQAGIEVVEIS